MEQLLSVAAVAERTGTTAAFWRKLIQQRRISSVKLGRLRRLRVEDVERFVRDGHQPASHGR